MICGALSGLGGICFAYSISANFSSSIYVGYGYLAIAALIFGNWRILPTLGACLLFGFARSGGYRLVQVLQMPSSYQDLVMILPYVLTLLLLVFFSKQNGAPRALGVILLQKKRKRKAFSFLIHISWKWDSNPRPLHYEWSALPTELFQRTRLLYMFLGNFATVKFIIFAERFTKP